MPKGLAFARYAQFHRIYPGFYPVLQMFSWTECQQVAWQSVFFIQGVLLVEPQRMLRMSGERCSLSPGSMRFGLNLTTDGILCRPSGLSIPSIEWEGSSIPMLLGDIAWMHFPTSVGE